MTFWDWLQHHGGTFLLAVVLVAVLAIVLYRAVRNIRRQARRPPPPPDERVDHAIEAGIRRAGLTFCGPPEVNFFGKLRLVRRVGTDHYGACLVLPSELVTQEVVQRFNRYLQALRHSPIPSFSPIFWWHSELEQLALVQEQIIGKEGYPRMTLGQYLLDWRMETAETIRFLSVLGRALDALHKLEERHPFYHGWLLPRSIHLLLDPTRKMRGIVVADGGVAFSLGPQHHYNRLQALHQRQIGLDAYRAHRLMNQLIHLSPEQQDKKRLDQVGPSCDYFAFGSLAVRLFGGHPLSGKVEANFENCPQEWRGFIQACLDPDPAARPDSFESVIAL